MAHDRVMTAPRNRDGVDDMSSTLAAMEERIELLEVELSNATPLILERDRLLRARAALRGEPAPPDLRSVRRVSHRDVEAFLRECPGSRAGEIAAGLGGGQPAISAHLYRGKGTRFESRAGRWFLRGEPVRRS